MKIKYLDKHFNIYAAYGPHRLWENNLTSALGKLLHYSPPAFRKSFAREFLKAPSKSHSDYAISLQRQDSRVVKCPKKYSLLLRPHDYIDHTEFSDRIARKRKDPRPDLWLVREDCSQSILVEVKLWRGEGRSQASDYAKQFNATPLKEVTFEKLHQWLSRQKATENEFDFLRQSLIAYLDDFGVTSSNRFSTRYFSVADGKFEEPILLKRHLTSLSSFLAENFEDTICPEPHVGNISSNDKSVYIDFGPKNKESLAYPALGFHTDGLYPSVFISGLRSKWGGKYSGKKGMDTFLKLVEAAQENKRLTGFEKVLAQVPQGTELILKAYRQRVKFIAPESHEPRATFIKQSNTSWKNKDTRQTYSARRLLHHIIFRINRLHGKKIPKSSFWQYSAIGLSGKCIPYSEIERSGVGAEIRFKRELERLMKYVALVSKS